jgi:uncharacterized membrane protein YdjX (TVP38/TMEM64 family)
LFGWLALLLVYPAVVFGSLWTNVLTRLWFADRLRTRFFDGKRWFALLEEELLKKNNWRSFVTMTLARWSPLHVGLTNCLFGVLDVPFWVFSVASLAGALDCPIWVSLGMTVRTAVDITNPDNETPGQWVALSLQIFATTVLLVALAVISRRIARKLKMDVESSVESYSSSSSSSVRRGTSETSS